MEISYHFPCDFIFFRQTHLPNPSFPLKSMYYSPLPKPIPLPFKIPFSEKCRVLGAGGGVMDFTSNPTPPCKTGNKSNNP